MECMDSTNQTPKQIIHCPHDELVKINKLKKHPKNRNSHPDAQVERLAKILEYQGFRYPVKVSKRSGFVVSGHGRILAAKKLGWKEVPVSFQDYDSDEQEYSDAVSDNAIASWSELDLSGINNDLQDLGPDYDIDLLGIRGFILEPAEKLEPQCDEDEVPEVKHPISQKGDVWILGNHRLMCGDSTIITDVEKLMDGEKADMVFTDPPYGIKEEGDRSKRGGLAKGNKLKSFVDDSISYAIDAFNLCQGLRIDRQVWFGANYYCHSIPLSNNWLVWDKRVEDQNKDTNSDCELAWVQDGHQSVRIFRHLWKGMIKESEHGSKRVHPTQKPIALAEWCFEKYGDPKSVLDLFGGSGSTLIACEKTNRICFMMELDPHYVDVIVSRWEKFTGKIAVLDLTYQTYEELKAVRNG